MCGCSTDLRYDARRDLEDVNADDIEVFPKEKDSVPKGHLGDSFDKGVLFVTYRCGVVPVGHWNGSATGPCLLSSCIESL